MCLENQVKHQRWGFFYALSKKYMLVVLGIFKVYLYINMCNLLIILITYMLINLISLKK